PPPRHAAREAEGDHPATCGGRTLRGGDGGDRRQYGRRRARRPTPGDEAAPGEDRAGRRGAMAMNDEVDPGTRDDDASLRAHDVDGHDEDRVDEDRVEVDRDDELLDALGRGDRPEGD